jgi:hypothetical protein
MQQSVGNIGDGMMRSILEEETALELQHINVKLFVRTSGLDLEPVIPIFHSWIQDQFFDELLLDVADYRHVKDGPGVVLIGHEADYSLDNTDGRLGVRYNRKAPLAGSNRTRLEQATRSALTGFQKLQTDSRLNGKLAFSGVEVEISVNDRLLAPNRPETLHAVDPEFRAFATRLFGPEYSLTYSTDPRCRFGAAIKSRQFHSIEELLGNLG